MNALKFSILSIILLAGLNGFSQNDKKNLKNAERHIQYEEYAQAIPELEKAINLNSSNAESRFLMGMCLFITHKKAAAEVHLRKAYQLNPEVSNELNYYYAQSLHYTLKFDEAIVMYKRALANFSPKDVEYEKIQRAIKNCEYGKESVKKPNGAKIVNVGVAINSAFSEHSPVITADESMMIFTSRRPGNTGSAADGSYHDEDIYMTEKVNDKWTKPVNLGKPINTKDHDASIGLTPDGQKMYIYKNPPGNGDIFECELKGSTWSSPRNMGSPINTKSYETTVSISFDGKTLFFASDRPGGYGDLDIYMTVLQKDGKWTEPKNMGPKINTALAEDAPFYHPNGRTLFFSSDGHESIGGYDIFKTELDEKGNWSQPENLGYPINTPDDDIYFVLSADGKHGYYSSAKENGFGEKDIYQIIMPVDPPPVKAEVKDTTAKVVKTKPVAINTLTILKGTVNESVSSKPVEASIKVIDNTKNLMIAEFNSNSSTGKYLVSLPSGKNYGIQVEAEGYLFHTENVDIPLARGFQEIIKNIELKKIEIGSSIVLRNIFFDHDAATLRPESVSELERLRKLLTDVPNLVIEISGHTDDVGSDTYNQKLSERRAQAVVKYLVDNGVIESRLQAIGYGEAQPIESNDGPEGRQNNRRTEFKILKN